MKTEIKPYILSFHTLFFVRALRCGGVFWTRDKAFDEFFKSPFEVVQY